MLAHWPQVTLVWWMVVVILTAFVCPGSTVRVMSTSNLTLETPKKLTYPMELHMWMNLGKADAQWLLSHRSLCYAFSRCLWICAGPWCIANPLRSEDKTWLDMNVVGSSARRLVGSSARRVLRIWMTVPRFLSDLVAASGSGLLQLPSDVWCMMYDVWLMFLCNVFREVSCESWVLTPSTMTAVNDSLHTRRLPERCQFPYSGVASLANCSEGWRL